MPSSSSSGTSRKQKSSPSGQSLQKSNRSSPSPSKKMKTPSSCKSRSSESRSRAGSSDNSMQFTTTPEKKANHIEKTDQNFSASATLHDLPFSKIRSIMTSTPETMRANDEGLFAMTKAAEAFIAMLAKGAFSRTKNRLIQYSNLADYVQGSENLSHIHEMVPRKVRFSSVERAVRAAQSKC